MRLLLHMRLALHMRLVLHMPLLLHTEWTLLRRILRSIEALAGLSNISSTKRNWIFQ